MVLIRFANAAAEKKGLGFLARRFTMRTFRNGQTLVPDNAVRALAAEGLRFKVEKQGNYESRIPPLRNLRSSSVQRRKRSA